MVLLIQIKKQLKLLFNNRLTIIVAIFIPIALSYLFSNSINHAKKPQLYIADLDNSTYSGELIQMLHSHQNITLVSATEKEIIKKVDDQSIAMGFIIGKNFETALLSNQSLPIKIVKNVQSSDAAILKQILVSDVSNLQKIISDVNYISSLLNTTASANDLSLQLLNKRNKTSLITVLDQSKNTNEHTSYELTIRLFGFLAMFIWFVIIQGFRTLIDERENRTFYRILSAPIHYSNYLFGKTIATYLFGMFHILAVLAIGRYLLKIRILTNLFPIIIIFSCYLCLLTGISLLLSLLMKKHEDFTISFSILIIVTGMLGGCFFSLETAPASMQALSKFTPEGFILTHLNDTIINNQSIASQCIPLFIMIGIGLFGVLLSIVIMNTRISIKQDLETVTTP
ncbi:MAG: ABC transporter permease [Velocimicrobium sp.]